MPRVLEPPPPLSAPIDRKIDWAERAFAQGAETLAQAPGFAGELEGLAAAGARARRAMEDAGIVALCAACETQEGGSCCGVGLEDRYDALLLLLNRLMGVDLPTQTALPGSCRFLGPAGCLLAARHVICINYLCTKAERATDPGALERLREREGEEVEALFRLHERLGRLVRRMRAREAP